MIQCAAFGSGLSALDSRLFSLLQLRAPVHLADELRPAFQPAAVGGVDRLPRRADRLAAKRQAGFARRAACGRLCAYCKRGRPTRSSSSSTRHRGPAARYGRSAEGSGDLGKKLGNRRGAIRGHVGRGGDRRAGQDETGVLFPGNRVLSVLLAGGSPGEAAGIRGKNWARRRIFGFATGEPELV